MKLNKKVKNTIDTLTAINRESNMIAINASISASQFKHQEGRTFKVLAKEIQRLSNRSLSDIKNLEEVLEEINKLSYVINRAGSLRMYSQQHLKLLLVYGEFPKDSYKEELIEIEKTFFTILDELKAMPIVSVDAELQIVVLRDRFLAYLDLASGKMTEALINLNSKVLQEAQYLVDMLANNKT